MADPIRTALVTSIIVIFLKQYASGIPSFRHVLLTSNNPARKQIERDWIQALKICQLELVMPLRHPFDQPGAQCKNDTSVQSIFMLDRYIPWGIAWVSPVWIFVHWGKENLGVIHLLRHLTIPEILQPPRRLIDRRSCVETPAWRWSCGTRRPPTVCEEYNSIQEEHPCHYNALKSAIKYNDFGQSCRRLCAQFNDWANLEAFQSQALFGSNTSGIALKPLSLNQSRHVFWTWKVHSRQAHHHRGKELIAGPINGRLVR